MAAFVLLYILTYYPEKREIQKLIYRCHTGPDLCLFHESHQSSFPKHAGDSRHVFPTYQFDISINGMNPTEGGREGEQREAERERQRELEGGLVTSA